MKVLSAEKQSKFEHILKNSKISNEIGKLDKQEKVEIKAYSIKKAIKLKKYVRN